ncbi:signal peptidase II [Roseomonas gilardii]|jgi:signal peptidase II|uniref:Lipoprotein signal peptidase n=2 Tax=Roseomonas gilardii TaxID=257708 RepID=A0ABU3MAW6_9PROT|nr:signal peptidase II [Roseomonas gilardii]MDT8329748.1 signal peptidase II [Roseomonas gilardii]SUE43518.1 Lipoprotein signal peptidase [Roseomonas gilardii subsp. rosea]
MPSPATPARMIPLGLVAAVLVLVADQASKWWMGEVLRLPERGHVPLFSAGPFSLDLSMVWNRGVTFGLMAGDAPWHGWLLAGLALVITLILLRWMARAETRPVAVALGAVIGGAIGNVIDRLRFGAVFDFVDASFGGWHWYVFNIADAAIVLGVIALVADALFRPPSTGRDGVAKEPV